MLDKNENYHSGGFEEYIFDNKKFLIPSQEYIIKINDFGLSSIICKDKNDSILNITQFYNLRLKKYLMFIDKYNKKNQSFDLMNLFIEFFQIVTVKYDNTFFKNFFSMKRTLLNKYGKSDDKYKIFCNLQLLFDEMITLDNKSSISISEVDIFNKWKNIYNKYTFKVDEYIFQFRNFYDVTIKEKYFKYPIDIMQKFYKDCIVT
jgi:hypothetical protein